MRIVGIVEPHDSDLLRHTQPRAQQGFQRSGCRQVFAADDTVRYDALRQQRLHRLHAGCQRLACFQHMVGKFQPIAAHGFQKAVALGLGTVRVAVLDVVDTLASARNEMLHRQRDAVFIVYRDRVGVGQVELSVCQHHRHAGKQLFHLGALADRVKHRADQHDAVHLLLVDGLQVAQRFCPVTACVAKDDLISTAAELPLNGIGGAGVVRYADVHRQNRDGTHRFAHHTACNGAGGVVVLL